jgi:hypothetical protein
VTAAARVVYDDQQMERAPLAQAMRATRPEDRGIMVGDLMWMGAVDLIDGRRLHPYKHTDTRRYLRLDADGHAYALVAGDYRIHETPGDAIDELRLRRQFDDPTFDQLSVINTFVGGKSVVP